MEQRMKSEPWKRPRSEDLRTGERVYTERRKTMRWCVHLGGEHGEGLESRERFDEIVKAFRVKLEVNGYVVDAHACGVDEREALADIPVVFDESLGIASEPVVEPEEESLEQKIVKLQKAAENAHMSQRELAEALGVSRYQIKKALENLK